MQTPECWILRAATSAPLLILMNSPTPAWRAEHLTDGCWLEHVCTRIDPDELISELVAALVEAAPIVRREMFVTAASYGKNARPGAAEAASIANEKIRAALAKARSHNPD